MVRVGGWFSDWCCESYASSRLKARRKISFMIYTPRKFGYTNESWLMQISNIVVICSSSMRMYTHLLRVPGMCTCMVTWNWSPTLYRIYHEYRTSLWIWFGGNQSFPINHSLYCWIKQCSIMLVLSTHQPVFPWWLKLAFDLLTNAAWIISLIP